MKGVLLLDLFSNLLLAMLVLLVLAIRLVGAGSPTNGEPRPQQSPTSACERVQPASRLWTVLVSADGPRVGPLLFATRFEGENGASISLRREGFVQPLDVPFLKVELVRDGCVRRTLSCPTTLDIDIDRSREQPFLPACEPTGLSR